MVAAVVVRSMALPFQLSYLEHPSDCASSRRGVPADEAQLGKWIISASRYDANNIGCTSSLPF